jgi:hypothetical protein
MDPDRKRQIIDAEVRFTLRERLNRALAEKGVYVVGRLTHQPGVEPVAFADVDQTSNRSPATVSANAGQATTANAGTDLILPGAG